MTTQLQVNDIANFDVHHSKETLIPLLELALVKDLDCDDRVVLDSTGTQSALAQVEGAMHAHVEALVPVRVKRLLHDARGVGLLCIDGDNSEWVRETEDLALGQAIGGNDWAKNELRARRRRGESYL